MNHNLLRGRTDQGLTYHVTSKVNRDAFELEPDDMKQLFLSVIEGAIKKGFKFKLWNFCVMGNHFHFLITPEKGESLSSIMKWIKMGMRYGGTSGTIRPVISGGIGFSHGR
jgi:REP element-mobilizing transposase RayT